ncbi:MAG: UbiH/UbiF/VisC/COQ6 family ubiquinone biosynthesis hydroxylase [Rhodospirillales bacterium]|jgi:2-octaprenyl-6-methoxyphenol hydroxylase|nr:UbiH/UbiF/VisC/COQ6 family ubiquinone biosynthesis hydroxylase [Rhodospirillales bacterium]HJO97004.1 UbiH/UbiF/VisC/COQ6 family ubiquinone biosynthesis hydroxylase [Rhodospirillales bacterium]
MTARTRPAATLDADVLIVGGGLVGGTLACALGGAGMDVVVVDREDPQTALEAAFDGRASAIALASQRLLRGVGLWGELEPRAAPILDIRVADGSSPLSLHYDHGAVGDQPFGYMIENRDIRRALALRLAALENVHNLAPAAVAGLDRSPGGAEARLADGRRVRAALVIGADGRGSQTRSGAKIRVTRWSYGQTAIVCTVAHERPHGNVAIERFLPAGPFAILPLTGDRSSLVWTERADLAPAIMALGAAEFAAELGRRFGDFLGTLKVVGPRWSYPLSAQFASTITARRLALAGDAAQAIHPIAGQGLNLGVRDAAALAEVVVDARRLGLDIGSGTVLEGYRRWRRFDSLVMIAVTDGLNRLFSNNVPALRLARDLGLAAVEKTPPVKKVLMRHAMGVLGELPRLMQGEAL